MAHNRLMFGYVDDIRRLFRDDTRITFACTSTRAPADSGEIRRACDENGVTYIHPTNASLQWWDLAMFADHGAAHAFNPAIPKVFQYHGLDGSKTLSGGSELYRYARRYVLDRSGKPLYSRMFDASVRSRDNAVRTVPALGDSVVVVGDLRADELLALDADREAVRARLRIGDEEKVVLIGSTFGTESLMETVGGELIEQARALQGRYRFVLSTHPIHWQRREDGQASLGESLLRYREEGFVVHEQPGALSPYLAAADAVVTDFGSLGVNYSLLKRPLAFVRVPPGIVADESLVGRLMKAAPELAHPADLGGLLERMFEEPVPDAVLRVVSDVVSVPGEAAQRIRAEIYSLLNLEEPKPVSVMPEVPSPVMAST